MHTFVGILLHSSDLSSGRTGEAQSMAEGSDLSKPIVEKGWFGKRFNNPWSTWKDPSELSVANLFKFGNELRKAGINGWLKGNKKPTASDFRYLYQNCTV